MNEDNQETEEQKHKFTWDLANRITQGVIEKRENQEAPNYNLYEQNAIQLLVQVIGSGKQIDDVMDELEMDFEDPTHRAYAYAAQQINIYLNEKES